jgi:hypothetical protein
MRGLTTAHVVCVVLALEASIGSSAAMQGGAAPSGIVSRVQVWTYALREGRFAFSPAEATRMRASHLCVRDVGRAP